ncbi:MAG: hypothetical protein CL928_16360 [Deltaproteobacteria bacterium]|nr:hypothetical protein [Deltaproteobacteria bacterium]
MHHCHQCEAEVRFERRVGRAHECSACSSPLHCCLNCRFHEPTAHNECREVGTELVRDRAAGNFCDAFEFRQGVAQSGGSSEVEEAREKLAGLFKI